MLRLQSVLFRILREDVAVTHFRASRWRDNTLVQLQVHQFQTSSSITLESKSFNPSYVVPQRKVVTAVSTGTPILARLGLMRRQLDSYPRCILQIPIQSDDGFHRTMPSRIFILFVPCSFPMAVHH